MGPPPVTPSRGILYVVATPIGNLGDMTQRAIDVLRAADVVLAEDTRSARVLFERFRIPGRAVAVHDHNEARAIPDVLSRLGKGQSVALISEAGTPLISDPGDRLVRAARDAGFAVSPVPGASALTAALSAGGIDTTRFTFFGFLPRAGRERREAVTAISGLSHTGVLYEAPGRLSATLTDLASAGAGERRCVVARELTKVYEEFREGTVQELAAYYAGTPPRGEVVVLLSGKESKPLSDDELRGRLNVLREAGLSARDAAARVAAETGASRNAVYRIALRK